MDYTQAVALFNQHRALHEANGVSWAMGCEPKSYVPDEFRRNFQLALDSQPALVTAPNSAIPAFLTTMVDPAVFKILFAPTKGAQILGENRKGSWLDQTA